MMAGLKLRPQYSEPVEFNIYNSLRKEWSEKMKHRNAEIHDQNQGSPRQPLYYDRTKLLKY